MVICDLPVHVTRYSLHNLFIPVTSDLDSPGMVYICILPHGAQNWAYFCSTMHRFGDRSHFNMGKAKKVVRLWLLWYPNLKYDQLCPNYFFLCSFYLTENDSQKILLKRPHTFSKFSPKYKFSVCYLTKWPFLNWTLEKSVKWYCKTWWPT